MSYYYYYYYLLHLCAVFVFLYVLLVVWFCEKHKTWSGSRKTLHVQYCTSLFFKTMYLFSVHYPSGMKICPKYTWFAPKKKTQRVQISDLFFDWAHICCPWICFSFPTNWPERIYPNRAIVQNSNTQPGRAKISSLLKRFTFLHPGTVNQCSLHLVSLGRENFGRLGALFPSWSSWCLHITRTTALKAKYTLGNHSEKSCPWKPIR